MGEIGGAPFETLVLDLFSKRRDRLPCPSLRSPKRIRVEEEPSPFETLAEEILFLILDRLDANPLDRKAFSLVSRSFHAAESRHRRALRPLRAELLPAALARYPAVSRLDLSLCRRVGDAALGCVAAALRSTLRSIDLSRSRSFSPAGLESLAVSCAALVEIDLSNATDLTDAAAAAIGKARNLERLWLARCMRVTDMGIGCIAVGCPKLRLLCLKWCLGVTDLGVGLVAVKCRMLQSLDLSYTAITKKSVAALSQLHDLEDLAVVGCPSMSDEALSSLKQGFKSLEVLDVSSCDRVSHVGLSSILNSAPGLRQLRLAYHSFVTPSISSGLQRLSKLQSINLDCSHVTTNGLKSIGSCCTSLKELSLSKCSGVTDEGLSFISSKNKGLVKLDITCCREITDVGIATMTSSCTSLTSLRMESCSLVTSLGLRLIGQRCHLLEELDLTDNDLDDEGLKSISGCHKLSSLKAGICLKISDEGLVHIGNSCPELQELDLYRSVGVTDKGVTEIARGCPLLQMINLAYCTEMTDESLRALSKCSSLKTLEIRGCPRVSSAGLSAIAVGCRQIAKLDIKKCHDIDDAGMLPLARFSQNLRQINLSFCSVTDVGLLALVSVSCLQNMTILHLKGVTPNGLAAALLACGGLTKVKLHSSFKSLISKPLLQHIEARGCSFQWISKPFQVQLETNEVWKQQLQDVVVR
ncbi:F-box/LRR-repeat protein 3 [Ananas comosus]|uniref:F-box/LRR-repeat protein 3 n=1 Tax=Ananas comosus TaxID=4615 RepID=A0A199UDD9_ANACO|nr:F-box/LRR-repeat protein 3 [Ananas comosus]